MLTKMIVASMNPVKIRAALMGFQAMFPAHVCAIEGRHIPSGVSAQPRSEEETLCGARNRAENARTMYPTVDYWVGIEGGIEEVAGGMVAFAWVVVLSHTLRGEARTATFFLPDAVAALVRAGKELGEADDIIFQRMNSKQEDGAVGLLTGQVIDRMELYKSAVVLACIPFKNPQLYATPEQ